VKKHPDCQPGSAVTVQGSDYDDGNPDQQFEGEGIDDLNLTPSKRAKG
jgi:hypothetical protein